MVSESKTDGCLFPHLQNEPVYETLEFHLCLSCISCCIWESFIKS